MALQCAICSGLARHYCLIESPNRSSAHPSCQDDFRKGFQIVPRFYYRQEILDWDETRKLKTDLVRIHAGNIGSDCIAAAAK